jgi:hypothetical protein
MRSSCGVDCCRHSLLGRSPTEFVTEAEVDAARLLRQQRESPLCCRADFLPERAALRRGDCRPTTTRTSHCSRRRSRSVCPICSWMPSNWQRRPTPRSATRNCGRPMRSASMNSSSRNNAAIRHILLRADGCGRRRGGCPEATGIGPARADHRRRRFCGSVAEEASEDPASASAQAATWVWSRAASWTRPSSRPRSNCR